MKLVLLHAFNYQKQLIKQNIIYIIFILQKLEIEYLKNLTHKIKKNNIYLSHDNHYTYIRYKLKKIKIDLFFPLVHGKNTEDGTLYSYLAFHNAKILGHHHTEAAILQDKAYTKEILKVLRIETLKHFVVHKRELSYDLCDKIIDKLGKDIIIKAARLGSSIGIKVIKKDTYTKELLMESINNIFEYDDKIIIEPYISSFMEFNQAVYYYENKYHLSEIEQIEKNSDILTYEDKYLNQNKITTPRHIIDGTIFKELENKITNTTKKIVKHFNLIFVIRVDYIYDLENNKLYVNEINTIPGSLANYLFKHKISYQNLIDHFIEETLKHDSCARQVINTSVLEQKLQFLKK
jgi:D-alanine-D-alanine ligase